MIDMRGPEGLWTGARSASDAKGRGQRINNTKPEGTSYRVRWSCSCAVNRKALVVAWSEMMWKVCWRCRCAVTEAGLKDWCQLMWYLLMWQHWVEYMNR